MPEQTTIGIDWSMNSPAICIHTGDKDEWHFDNCTFKYFTGPKKLQVKSDKVEGWPIPDYDEACDINRWVENSSWAGKRLSLYQNALLGMEGYSYGSKGSLPFSIAENTAILKYTIKQMFPSNKLNIFAPGAIKKFACGKGNADKNMMYDAFFKETKFDITKVINGKPGANPISDIVDSYFIAKLTYYNALL